MSEVSPASIAKMGRNENVTTEVLLRICEALDCNIEDVMEHVPVREANKYKNQTIDNPVKKNTLILFEKV